jgi:hypothetical protein
MRGSSTQAAGFSARYATCIQPCSPSLPGKRCLVAAATAEHPFLRGFSTRGLTNGNYRDLRCWRHNRSFIRIFHNIYALSDPLRFALLPRIGNYVSRELTGITMKKSQLLDIVGALILFATNSSACAAIIASDDTSIASTGQSYAQTLASSSSSFSDGALTLDVPGDSGQTEFDENFGYFIDGTLPVERPSHASLWLLLIAAVVAGILSEIFHRRSVNG